MKIEINNSYCKVVSCTEEEKERLSKLLSYEDTNTKYMKVINPKLYGFDSSRKLFHKGTKKFPTGLLDLVINEFEDIEKVDLRKPVSKYLYLVKNVKVNLRYYQQEALEIISKNFRGTLEMATGCGKTLIALEIIFQKGVNTLYITPSLNINDQTLKIFQSYFGKKNVGTHKDIKVKPITICNYQGIQKKDESFFSNFDMILIDEAHHSNVESIVKINKKYWDRIYYRFFITATAYRNDGSDMALKGIIGETLYSYSAVKAIKDEFLSPPYFFIYKVKHSGFRYEKYHEEYEQEVVLNESRNKNIADICNQIYSESNKQILVLLERIEHGEILHKMIKDSHWISGETKDNLKSIEQFNLGEIKILIATDVVGEGIDLPRVSVLIIAGSGKAKSKVYQKIGRVLRICPNKNKALVIDFLDEGTNWIERHAKKRIKYYRTFETEVTIIE